MTNKVELEPIFVGCRAFSVQDHLEQSHPHLDTFHRAYPFSLEMQEAASEHYPAQSEMNQVEELLFQSGIALSHFIPQIAPSILTSPDGVAVIGMPRSGWSIARGVATSLAIPCYFSNQGKNADPSEPILHPDIVAKLPSNVIMVDNILWGIRQAQELHLALSQKNHIFLVSGVDRVEARELKIPIITGFADDFQNYLRHLLS